MKRLSALLLCTIMLLGLTACGSSSGGSTSGKVTLNVWTWDINYAFFSNIEAAFEEANPDIDIVLEEMGTTQIYDKLTTGLQTGAGLPDIFTVEGEQMAKFGTKFPDKMLELSDIVTASDFADVKMGEVTVNGKIIACPWDSAPAALFYRTDLFEEAGIDADDIKTWDDYIKAGITVKEKLGISMLPMSSSRSDILFRMIMNQCNGFYFDKDGNSTINSDAAKKAMRIVKELYDAELTLEYSSWDEYVTCMKEGDVATVAEAVWIIGSFKEEAPDTKGKWGVMPFPMVDETSTGVPTNGGSVAAIPASTQHPEEAKRFIEYALINTDSQMKAFTEYGLFPSYKPVFASPDFSGNDEFFGNEDIYTMFGELVEKIPSFNYTQNFEEAVEMSKNAMARVLLNNADPDETLDNLQAEYVSKFGK